jgi:polar amino acid transport system substrate-binding protein
MLRKYLSVVFLFTNILLYISPLNAQTKSINSTNSKLVVGIAGSAPFVLIKNGDPKGIAIEIWQDIALKKDWKYSYKEFTTVENALHALNNNEIDLVVGPISITSKRLEHMRFSQPFYNSSLAIVSRSEQMSLWKRIKPIFSFKLLGAVGIFLIILAFVGTLLWLAERKKSPDQFPNDALNGIGTGMWLAIVTMSTTGYGDKAPITLKGRIIAGSWMIISIIFATSMVAGIASTLTISSLGTTSVTNIEQLSRRKVATIANSPSEVFLKEYKSKITRALDLDEAFTLLNNKEVDAVVYDRPQLLHYLKKNNSQNLYLAKAEYYKQGYGFAFSLNSTLVYDVNRALLELTEDQETQRIVNYYLDKDE